VLKKQTRHLKKYDVSVAQAPVPRRRAARRPTTSGSPSRSGSPVIDHYWQTETGCRCSPRNPAWRNALKMARRASPVYGYDVRLPARGDRPAGRRRREGVVTIAPPLPPGCNEHGVGRRRALRGDLLQGFQDQLIYSTFDWGIRDKDGYFISAAPTRDHTNFCSRLTRTRHAARSAATRQHGCDRQSLYRPILQTAPRRRDVSAEQGLDVDHGRRCGRG